jgi:hypothetical protein
MVLNGVSLEERAISTTLRVVALETMPTTLSRSTTTSAPMFLSAINLTASYTEAVGPMVWTA